MVANNMLFAIFINFIMEINKRPECFINYTSKFKRELFNLLSQTVQSKLISLNPFYSNYLPETNRLQS
jgi:hypothetical protein